jgi:hypothetical protein
MSTKRTIKKDAGNAKKQILKNAKLKTGNRGQETEQNG